MQPVIRDSEDEDEDESLVPDAPVANKPSQQSTNSWMIAEADAILADNPSQESVRKDETVYQSSLSTGDLQRQIADASRGLFDSTSDQATMKQTSMASSSTPAAEKARRHSAVIGSGSSAKANKRIKTGNVTYGSGKSTRPIDNGHFDAFREEAFPGTLQANFANHEPVVMFRDTGSTVADNESSQQRMLEQTINQGKQLSTVTEAKAVERDKPDSSPFPWAVSSIATQTPAGVVGERLPQDNVTTQESVAKEELGSTGETLPRRGTANDIPNAPEASPKQPSLQNVDKNQPTEEAQSHPPGTRPAPNSSPQVSVPRMRVKSSNQASQPSDDPREGRKRKASAARLESMNSDDLAIGMPKELYKPRPSRRRATGVIEQPRDFSVNPEKATKRRRKTAIAASVAPEPAEDELAHDSTAAPHAKAMPKGDGSSDPSVMNVTDVEPAMATTAEAIQPGRKEVRAALKKLNFPLTNTSFDDCIPDKPSPTQNASSLSAKEIPAPKLASMPPPSSPALPRSPTKTSPEKKPSNAAADFTMPPPTSSMTRKSRRSHTTIFEDHVAFGGSQRRSPSLKQQQAARKSAALDEVKNESTQAARRKRRSIVQDEDDEDDEDQEDELAKTPVIEAVALKKRGLPVKDTGAKEAAQAGTVLHDSNAEPNDEEIVQPSKKKGSKAKTAPASKPKTAERVLEDSESEFDEHEIEDDEPPKKRAGGCRSKPKPGCRADGEVVTTNDVSHHGPAAKPTSRWTSAASNPPATPPPEKQTTPLAAKQDATPNAAPQTEPATHTPIKPTSKVIHRVGLNRRQRVQPLLKIVRPPIPAKQR